MESAVISPSLWISSKSFQGLTGTSRAAVVKLLAKCFDGGTWNGTALQVRKNGRAYEVHAASLPLPLYTKLRDQNPDLFKPAEPQVVELPVNPDVDMDRVAMLTRNWRLAEWKAELIAPALAYPPRSRPRKAVLERIAAQEHIRPTDGKPVRFTLRLLQSYCLDFEEGGVEGLMRKARTLETEHRHLINKKWDEACPLPEFEKRRIAQEVEQHIRNLWVSGATSRDKVRQFASANLYELCHAAGWTEATLQQCDVGQYIVERNQDCRVVAIKHKDAKRHFDKYKPRVARSRETFKPGEAIVGDVHPVDVLLMRPDGSEYTARMIAWYDLGTNRFFYTLLHPGPRQSVTQADVARSFFEMCQAWGVPSLLYLDNGSEYKWDEMMDAFTTFSLMVKQLRVRIESIEALQAQFAAEAVPPEDDAPMLPSLDTSEDHKALVRAKPYNAPAKPIEGAFSALEKVLAMVPGYIGGDRMAKRLSRVGRRPDVYPGDRDAFDASFADAVSTYHNTPQRGFLKGMSPNEKAAAMEGHVKTFAPEIVFRMAFAEELRPKVQTGGIVVDGRWYYDDALIPSATRRVLVRYAKWAPDAVILVRERPAQGEAKYVLVRERPVYSMFDPAGAVESSRRESVQNRNYRELRKGTKQLDLLDEMQRYNRVHHGLLVTQTRAGRELVTQQIGMTSDLAALQGQLSAPNPNPVERLGAGDLMDSKGVIHKPPTLEEIQKEREAERAAKANRNRILDAKPVETTQPARRFSAVSDDAMEESRKVREAAERKRRLNGG